MRRVDDDIMDLLNGAIDTHVHTAPDAFDRHGTDFDIARRARAAGLVGFVIKSHHFETGSRAQLVTEETGMRVLGGITLNRWVGGLNPVAVDGAAALGARIVWMPTITARNHMSGGSVPHLDAGTTDLERGSGITVIDDDGSLKQAAIEVIERIAANDLILALGHLAPAEAMPLAAAASDSGVSEIICHHPFADFLDYTIEQLGRLVGYGATIEFHYGTTTPMMGSSTTVGEQVDAARILGPEHVILASDGGSRVIPPPLELLSAFIEEFRDAGVSTEDIRQMVSHTPMRVFRIG